jgi:CRISPR/Cas system-associated exonuclease Cas4 (RecB family)
VSDPRKGRPSVSGARRYQLCPGSFLAEKAARALGVTESSEWADRGTRIHGFCAGDPVELNDEERDVGEACLAIRDALRERYIVSECDHVHIERRFWRYGREHHDNYSGQPDVVYAWGRKALIVDYKTGREEVDAADINMQMRGLAVLVAAKYALTEVTVALVHPLQWPRYTVAVYDEQAIEQATEEIGAMMALIQQPGHPRIPSPEACKYCLAKGTPACTESQDVLREIAGIDGTYAIAWPVEHIATMLDRCKIAEDVIDSVRDYARKIIATGEQIPGWELKDGAAVETISDPVTVMQRVYAIGATQDDFLTTVSVGKGKLEKVVRKVTGAKGKALKDAVDGLIEGCTETKQKAPSLVRVKGTKWKRLS